VSGPKRIALTGATGFIGRRLAAALRARGHSVRALVRDPARAERMEALAGCALVALDLEGAGAEGDTLARALDGAEVLCHAAAYIPPDQRDPAHAGRCLRVNALGTLALIEGAGRAGVGRAVHFSSGNVYAPSPDPVDEGAPTYPAARATYYLASKLCGELYVEHARRRGALRACTLRVSSVYGPGMVGGVVSLFADRLAGGARVRVSDGGRYRTDLVLLDDVVSAAVSAIEREAVEGIVNVGSGRATTLLELARTLADILGRGEDAIEVEPAREGVTDLGFSPLEITRARDILDYTTTDLVEGLRATVAAR
jgi:UDP-glucose 4-epimerase